MNTLYPSLPNLPCFGSAFFTVTERTLRAHLKSILTDIGLDPNLFSFHSFRRSGATLAYNLDIDVEAIKRHGTWRSDAVYSYIIADPQKASGVANSFKKYFDQLL